MWYYWRRAQWLVRNNPIGALGALIIIAVGVVAISADWVAPYHPAAQITRRLTPPDGQHLLGADEFGRDVLSRIIHGSRISFYVAVVAVGIAVVAGGTTGLMAGYHGGTVDHVLMRLVDVTFAIPSVLLAIAIAGIMGPSLRNAVIAIGIVYAPVFARVARGSVLGVMGEEYVDAARTMGAQHLRIIVRHVLPNVTAPLIVQTTLALSTAILMEAALSFLGLGTQPPDPSWGTMLGTGRRFIEQAPWVAVYPGLAIMVVVLGFNLLGDGLRDALDPGLRET